MSHTYHLAFHSFVHTWHVSLSPSQISSRLHISCGMQGSQTLLIYRVGQVLSAMYSVDFVSYVANTDAYFSF